ncbi:MAG: aldehyde ferredoxin oxidoreductase family protein [Rectinemataceae bacterium]|jgi:aldehyde:ferredoxin oxidoreductase
MKGYSGRILHVDLTAGAFTVETPPESFYRQYAGGACMGNYYVFKGMPAGVDPLGPGNVLVFAISAVVGTPISGNSRYVVSAKSPLTGTLGSSEAGGYWGPELRFAGFDAVVITGKSPRPVYLWIHDGEYELRDAGHLWGRVTGEVQDEIRRELGDGRVRVAQIGPAGEKGVLYANIVNELKHFNGRCGFGAVMGSKNLRAIAVRGTGKPEYVDPDRIKALAKQAAAKVGVDGFYKDFRRLGTSMNMTWNQSAGGLPTRNWSMGTFSEWEKVSEFVYADKWMDRPGTCWACVQSCKRDIKEGIEKPWPVEARYGGPEYESLGMMGPNCMVSDFGAICKANELASKYCVDSISLGGVVGFVMECFEAGILTAKDLGGVEARFGSGEALVALSEMTVKREGFGDLMAEGTTRLAKHLGPRAERLAVAVKGKEFPAHMPTMKSSMGLIYAVNPFGPDHVSSTNDGDIAAEPNEVNKGAGIYEIVPNINDLNFEKTKMTLYSQRYVSAVDSWSVCQFIFHAWSICSLPDLVEVINAAIGWKYTMYELMLLGERRINIMRAFNAREGFSSAEDVLPRRLLDDGLLDDGPRKGARVDEANFLKQREYYYVMSGWDPVTGNPGEVKLRELGLGWAWEALQEARGVAV